MDEPDPVDAITQRLIDGDENALGEAFDNYNQRFRQIIFFRLDRRLAVRIDEDDIIQETYCDAFKRIESYTSDPKVSLFVWLRSILQQTMIDLHRKHLGAAMRSVAREISVNEKFNAQATSMSLAFQLIGNETSPSQAAMRDEMAEQVRSTIDSMEPIDREILALRHYEELTNSEIAEVLEITQATASVRYVRAVERLKKYLDSGNDFRESSES